MIFRRAGLTLLPFPAVLALCASDVDVDAAASCFASASAVRQEYPGSRPSRTVRAAGREGEKCWFASASPPHKGTSEVRKSPLPNEAKALNAGLPVSPVSTTGLALDPHDSAIEPDLIPKEASSFAERFAAVFDGNPASMMQVLMGTSGAPAAGPSGADNSANVITAIPPLMPAVSEH